MGGGESTDRTLVSADTFEKAAIPILVGALLLTIALGAQLFPMPVFDTDLSAFTPETPAEQAQNRMSDDFPSESRPMFIHVTTDDGANVLSMENLHLQQLALDEVMNRSQSSNDYIESVMAAPQIIQTAIDESNQTNDSLLSDYDSWSSLLDTLLDEGTECVDALGDDRALAAGAFIRDGLIHTDLDYSASCDYLSAKASDPNATGNAAPTASSTLWVLMIDPELDDTQRQVQQNFILSLIHI